VDEEDFLGHEGERDSARISEMWRMGKACNLHGPLCLNIVISQDNRSVLLILIITRQDTQSLETGHQSFAPNCKTAVLHLSRLPQSAWKQKYLKSTVKH